MANPLYFKKLILYSVHHPPAFLPLSCQAKGLKKPTPYKQK